ncbi:hypothetical protein J3458_012991 [Metarhizium acridum]|uniref:uncharacterized protein n=1 Tax=Metarhizium acridum TaxID=92637 RepID=UPI001C6C6025|nr:hypothetical protein J3458_012991 [Metarhizium acridum]
MGLKTVAMVNQLSISEVFNMVLLATGLQHRILSQTLADRRSMLHVLDPTRIVAQSISSKNPIIVITVNYRLNVFAFGDWNCMKNLALRDQRLAIEWVVRNIDEFNGDPGKLTLAGESAGAVYVHAHTFLDAPVQSAILASGSLFLSPPAATETANHMVKRLSEAAWKIAKVSLRDAPVAVLIQALSDCNITSMFLQSEPGLEDWKTRDENVSRLMIGDVEYESILWREGIEMMAADDIVGCFSQEHHHGAKLMELYRINPSRPTQTKIGALDFINDVCFALPVEMIAQRWKARKGEVYRYVFDQPNPWQPSSRAHHAVDLLYLFGGIDISSDSFSESVGVAFRQNWIDFASGQSPWPTATRFAFGPHGKCAILHERDFNVRRRVACFQGLIDAEEGSYRPILGRLAAGRLSLLN